MTAWLGACAPMTSLLPQPDRSWTSHVGQVSYDSKTRSFVGDVVLQTAPSGDLTLELTKGPGPALFSLRQTIDHAKVSGAAVGMGWQGNPANASTQLTGWLLIQPTIAALETNKPLPKGVTAKLKKAPDGRWQELKIEISSRRESFHFIFNS